MAKLSWSAVLSVFATAIIGLVWVGIQAPSAAAFVLEGPAHRAWTPQEDVDYAARWDANDTSFAESGARGLGGGLEFSMDQSVCDRLTFLDSPTPTCDQIRAALRSAFDRWAQGNPTLAFTDVSETVPVRLQGRTSPRDGQGAEIDIVASSVDEFRAFTNPRIAAMTVYYFDITRRPQRTDGRLAASSSGVLTAADIRLSTQTCYFLDPAFEKVGCAHFASLMKHEIGHVLGIDHPNETPERNLAPVAAAATGCDAASPTLYQPSAVIEAHAAAQSVLYGANVWRHGLTADDLAARDALYPPCAAKPAPSADTATLTAEAAPISETSELSSTVSSSGTLPSDKE